VHTPASGHTAIGSDKGSSAGEERTLKALALRISPLQASIQKRVPRVAEIRDKWGDLADEDTSKEDDNDPHGITTEEDEDEKKAWADAARQS
jgi:hypothetical protein